jgi:hypothetical protein
MRASVSPVELVESFLLGKTGTVDVCEDVLVSTPAVVAVVDGASDPHGGPPTMPTPARRAADAVAQALADAAAGAPARAVVDAASRAVAELAGPDPARAPCAVFAAYVAARREVWRVGDVHVRIDAVTHPPLGELDDRMTGARAALLRALVLEGANPAALAAEDPGAALIKPIEIREHLFRNRDADDPLGFGAIDGRPVPDRFLEVFPVASGATVILASDGYPVPAATLDEAETYLRADLERDPLRIGRHPGFRAVGQGRVSFDDRAYVRLRT